MMHMAYDPTTPFLVIDLEKSLQMIQTDQFKNVHMIKLGKELRTQLSIQE